MWTYKFPLQLQQRKDRQKCNVTYTHTHTHSSLQSFRKSGEERGHWVLPNSCSQLSSDRTAVHLYEMTGERGRGAVNEFLSSFSTSIHVEGGQKQDYTIYFPFQHTTLLTSSGTLPGDPNRTCALMTNVHSLKITTLKKLSSHIPTKLDLHHVQACPANLYTTTSITAKKGKNDFLFLATVKEGL